MRAAVSRPPKRGVTKHNERLRRGASHPLPGHIIAGAIGPTRILADNIIALADAIVEEQDSVNVQLSDTIVQFRSEAQYA